MIAAETEAEKYSIVKVPYVREAAEIEQEKVADAQRKKKLGKEGVKKEEVEDQKLESK